MRYFTDDPEKYLQSLRVGLICPSGHTRMFYPWELAAMFGFRCNDQAFEGSKVCGKPMLLSPPKQIGTE